MASETVQLKDGWARTTTTTTMTASVMPQRSMRAGSFVTVVFREYRPFFLFPGNRQTYIEASSHQWDLPDIICRIRAKEGGTDA